MSLKQEIGLDVRVVELAAAGQLVGQLVAQVPQDSVLTVTNLEVLELGRGRDDFDEAADFGLVVERHAEQLDGRVVDVVVGGDHALKG